MTDPVHLRCQLAAAVPVNDPAWRTALETVPRELFLGDALFQFDGRQWIPVRRDRTDPGKWLGLVCQDTTWVTQVDGVTATDATGPVTGRPTSSSTPPSLIVRMLDVAGISEGHKVLEIDTAHEDDEGLRCLPVPGPSRGVVSGVRAAASVSGNRTRRASARFSAKPCGSHRWPFHRWIARGASGFKCDALGPSPVTSGTARSCPTLASRRSAYRESGSSSMSGA
ncbi:hypothetical protein [Streptomyces pseudogriseolus]|uniref:hypothetical protein n=1 Tax=Streptomyces pseudogriseolus TaxID=36817 RepID=UPI003FA24DEA